LTDDVGEVNGEGKEDVVLPTAKKAKSFASSVKLFFRSLGPGIVTGGSDNDPSGIATYSQAGAQFGYGQLWMAIVTLPMVIVVQEMCARIGIVSGKGLAQIIKQHYSKKLLYSIASLLLIANTINIGADIGAMGASLRLLVPQVPFFVSTLIFTGIILAAEIFISYKTYSKILKYLTLSLFLYIATAFLAVYKGSEWYSIAKSTLVPHFEFNTAFVLMTIAILGTTISPYLFFWQTAQEVEEEVKKGKIEKMHNGDHYHQHSKPKITKSDLKNMRVDIITGMSLAQAIFWFIIITSASTLHNNGVTNISSAQEAARALEPLVKGFPYSGQIAGGLFAAGIIGTGLLAVPVLAGSASYAISESFGWKEGLYKKFGQAPKFYGIIIISTLIGLWINFSNIDPIRALLYTAVINGFVSVPVLIVVSKIANNKKILGDKVNKRSSNVFATVTVIAMASAAVAMIVYSWIL
jgi:NRAMP (natural resistance-associated macrophage protein)-like metal ion transporter